MSNTEQTCDGADCVGACHDTDCVYAEMVRKHLDHLMDVWADTPTDDAGRTDRMAHIVGIIDHLADCPDDAGEAIWQLARRLNNAFDTVLAEVSS